MSTSPKTLALIGAFTLAGGALLSGCHGKVEAASPPAQPAVLAQSDLEAGRYLVKIGGCNDCHTVGYVETNGAAPAEDQWLTGSPVGFAGPWGVSYPTNLRLYVTTLSEDDFVEVAHEGAGRPPMPWPSLMNMDEKDVRAIYRYIQHLGPAGEVMPAPLTPGQTPATPYVAMMPVMPD